MKKIFLTIILLLLLPSTVFAFEKRNTDIVIISSDELIEGSLFINANKIEINGTVNGDVFCFAQKIEINGIVNGDIICAGNDLNFSGTTTGNLRFISQKGKISGKIFKNTSVASSYLKIEDSAKLQGELLVFSNEAHLAGVIDGDLYGAVKDAYISSNIGGNLSLRQGVGIFSSKTTPELNLLNGTSIGGDFNYKSNRNYTKEEGVIIYGEENKTITKKEEKDSPINILWQIVSIFSTILIAFALIALSKNFIISLSSIITKQSVKSMWFGLLSFFLFPLTFILLLLTMIGIPLAIILLFVFVGIGLISKAIISIILGEKFLGLLKNRKKDSLNFKAVVGAVILFLLFSLPLIGSFLSFLTLVIVLGGILQHIRTNFNK